MGCLRCGLSDEYVGQPRDISLVFPFDNVSVRSKTTDNIPDRSWGWKRNSPMVSDGEVNYKAKQHNI